MNDTTFSFNDFYGDLASSSSTPILLRCEQSTSATLSNVSFTGNRFLNYANLFYFKLDLAAIASSSFQNNTFTGSSNLVLAENSPVVISGCTMSNTTFRTKSLMINSYTGSTIIIYSEFSDIVFTDRSLMVQCSGGELTFLEIKILSVFKKTEIPPGPESFAFTDTYEYLIFLIGSVKASLTKVAISKASNIILALNSDLNITDSAIEKVSS